MNDDAEKNPPQMGASPDTAQLIYILYLASVLLGITAVIGLIMAYLNKASAPEWLKTHYEYLINTFWKGLIYMLISAILTVVMIGFLTALGTVIWWIIRCIKGLQLLNKKQPVPDTASWLF